MKRASLILLTFILIVPAVHAQQRPFLYTITVPESEERGLVLHFDAGWGSGSLGSPEAAFIDRRVGLIWVADSKWTVLANVGFGENSRSETAFSSQAEIFYSFKRHVARASNPRMGGQDARATIPDRGFSFDLGGGMRWEQEDHAVALLHAISGWRSQSWLFESNVLLEKASSPERDPVDLIISAGWLYQISSPISIGVEAVGQDLEGFWEQEEAEGGARFLTGPSIHFHFREWEAGIAGGYVFRPTNSPRSNNADRAFGSDRLAVQFSLTRSF